MEGNVQRNVELGSQNLHVPAGLSKYATEQFWECKHCTTILLCLIILEIVRLLAKVY
jgi:hypothetical protein